VWQKFAYIAIFGYYTFLCC